MNGFWCHKEALVSPWCPHIFNSIVAVMLIALTNSLLDHVLVKHHQITKANTAGILANLWVNGCKMWRPKFDQKCIPSHITSKGELNRSRMGPVLWTTHPEGYAESGARSAETLQFQPCHVTRLYRFLPLRWWTVIFSRLKKFAPCREKALVCLNVSINPLYYLLRGAWWTLCLPRL